MERWRSLWFLIRHTHDMFRVAMDLSTRGMGAADFREAFESHPETIKLGGDLSTISWGRTRRSADAYRKDLEADCRDNRIPIPDWTP